MRFSACEEAYKINIIIIPGMCPGNSECWVFSKGMKIVAKNLENLAMFLKAFLTRFYELI
jgi:hypothetical protein